MAYFSGVYVVNLETGGQVSLYNFQFSSTCFNYVNGELLIGGSDGYLYKLDDTNTIFEDNYASYGDETYLKTSFEDWGLSSNYKHNKKILVIMSGDSNVTANLKIYKNKNDEVSQTVALTTKDTWGTIYSYTGQTIYSLAGRRLGSLKADIEVKKKFDYKTIMIGIENIEGNVGVEIEKIDLKTAIIGEK